ncbi:MAG: efflux transporter outer membrane subunit [Alistipes sp.]|nr:efflux transporter outer membrane subunit [Alistipes sp.]
MRRIPYILYIATAAVLVAGCNVRLAKPQLVSQEEYLFGKGFSHDSIALGSDWWRMFGDTTLNSLVERAIVQNKNIEIAASRIEEARHNLIVTRSAYWPSISGVISAEGKYESLYDNIAQSYKILPQASWELPLFGSLRHATKGAKAQIEYEVWQQRGVKLALEAEVATAYFTLLQYRQDLAIAKRSSELRREMVSLVDSLYRYGFASSVHLEQAQALLYTAEADIPLYEKAIAQTILSLATLTGDKAETLLDIGTEGSRATTNDYMPYDISIGVPSDVLHRRPDLMSAYYTMLQSASNVGLARTARLPSITISLYGGSAADKISSLFSSKGWVADALATLAQPIYNFGGLRRRELAAREAYKQSLLAYEQCYIEALSDVESALVAITTSREELLRYAGLVKSYRSIAIKTYALYRNGLSDYLDVIDAERSLYSSQMQFENLVAQQYINYINLCKALGGGVL